MTVQHNNTELTRVQGSSPENPYSMTLNYGGSMEQLEALIDGSEYCEQEVIYHCRRSRLLNTPGKVLSFFMVWWNIPIFCLFCFFFFFWQKLESLEKWQPQLKICLQMVIFLMTDMRSPVNYMLYYWIGCPEVYKKKTWKYTWEKNEGTS